LTENFIEYQGKYGAQFIMVTKDNTKAKRKIYENFLTWEFFNFRTIGYFVEVGANDPKSGSQTWLLERVGWTGLLIEPLPDKFDILREERPKSQVLQVAVSAPEKVGEQLFYISSDDVRSSLEKNVDDPGLVCSSAKGAYPCYNLGACKVIPQSLSWAIIPQATPTKTKRKGNKSRCVHHSISNYIK
jgi:hypothetical protein